MYDTLIVGTPASTPLAVAMHGFADPAHPESAPHPPPPTMSSHCVQLEVFEGPIDLLLYLVRRREIEPGEISLAQIVDPYLELVETLCDLEIDAVGDFIEVASLLVEQKARAVLPGEAGDDENAYADPRLDLVHRLLAYKQFRDAAGLLEDQYLRWQQQFARLADDLPPRQIDLARQPIKEVELWDLVSVFGRMLRDNTPPPPESIYYDETPIQVHMQRIHDRVQSSGAIAFSQLFEAGMHKSSMIGIFLALLELVRHHGVTTDQTAIGAEIWIRPGTEFRADSDLSIEAIAPTSEPCDDPSSAADVD